MAEFFMTLYFIFCSLHSFFPEVVNGNLSHPIFRLLLNLVATSFSFFIFALLICARMKQSAGVFAL